MPFASLINMLVRLSKSGNVPESQDAEASEHRGARKSPLALQIHIPQRGEDVVYIRSSLAEFVECIRKNVEPDRVSGYDSSGDVNTQQLRVGIGIHVSASFYIQEFAKIAGVDQISVHAHGQSKWRIDVKGLRLGPTSRVRRYFEAALEDGRR
jgi:hypothetical protein